MQNSSLNSLKIKAKLLQKKKRLIDASFALKDAYAIIAKSAGYSSWKEMRDEVENADLLNPPKWSAIWKTWITDYNEGLHLLGENEYLLPYKNQFFICDPNYIQALGIESNDPLLQKVGRDWVNPQDKAAFEAILERIRNRQKS